jgi:Flp pilus assembly protein TadD
MTAVNLEIALRQFGRRNRKVNGAKRLTTIHFVAITLLTLAAYCGMGILSNQKEDAASAIRFFSRALAIDPTNASAHYNLSKSYQMQGRMADAENEMKKFREAETRAQEKEGLSR